MKNRKILNVTGNFRPNKDIERLYGKKSVKIMPATV